MLIFLDIDGVLNGHEWCHLGNILRINPGPVQVLNKIIELYSPDFFISSTWGKHVEDWGPEPFAWMLKTHGIKAKILGGFNGSIDPETRSNQIYDTAKLLAINEYFIFDDLNLSTRDGPSRLLRTNPATGLQAYQVTEFKNMVERFRV